LRRKLQPLPDPTDEDRARWRSIAEDRSPVVVTADAPEVGEPIPGIDACVPPGSFRINRSVAKWYGSHGGNRTVARLLQAAMEAGKKNEQVVIRFSTSKGGKFTFVVKPSPRASRR
jgi:hypothetical protein